MAALANLGKWDKVPSLNNDKPNFYGYKKDCLPKLEFSYRVPKQEAIKEKIKIFQGKIFNIIFTETSKQKGMNINNLNEEQYREFIQEKFDNSEVWAFCGLDPEQKEEIRLILPKYNRVLFCSVTHGGKSLQCFSTIDKDIEKVRNDNKEILLSCQFKIEDKNGEYDDAKELRGFLKNISINKIVQRGNTNIDYENYKFLIYLDKIGETKRLYYPDEAFEQDDLEALQEIILSKHEELENKYSNYLDSEANEKWYEYFESNKNNTERLKYLYQVLHEHDKFFFILLILQQDVFSKHLELESACSNYRNSSENKQWKQQFENGKNDINVLNDLYLTLEEYYQKFKRYYDDEVEFPQLRKTNIDTNPINFPKLDVPKKKCLKEPNVNFVGHFIPDIIFYTESNIDNKCLHCEPSNIEKSAFFQSLFKAIGYDTKNIQQSYDDYEEQENADHYRKAGEVVNELLSKIIDKRFNDLYDFYNKDKGIYKFEIHFEEHKISLGIRKNGYPLNLNEQSEGFRKFFNFFFNFLYADTVGDGDIVLIDEAETHLSIPAQRDLRKFLKKFGQEHGILFVITTHSPFMLDMNHLDEIRILKTKGDGVGVEIINEFSQVGGEETDVDILKKIIEALGAKLYHLISPKTMLIFVEGVTDYHYLVALAACYNKEHKDKPIDLTFLPIGGLGKDEEQQSSKIESLISFSDELRILPAILLVDNDGAGRAIKKLAGEEKYGDSLQVILLNECEKLSKFPQDVEIEDLFSEKDREKFRISKEKNSQAAADFKNTKDLAAQLDEETKDNFYALLKYLENIASPRTIKHNPSSLFAHNLAILH